MDEEQKPENIMQTEGMSGAPQPVNEPAVQEPAQEVMQEPVQEAVQEPVQGAMQGVAQEPVQEVTPEPMQEVAPESTNNVVEQTSVPAQNPAQDAPGEKSRGGLIALIVILALFLGGAVTVLILQFTGVIQLQSLFSGGTFPIGGNTVITGKNSYGGVGAGQYGGVTDNSSSPDVERMRKVCEKYGNEWIVEEYDELSSNEDFLAHVIGAYTCENDYTYEDDWDDDSFEFTIAFVDTDFRNVDFLMNRLEHSISYMPEDGAVLENSDEFIKLYAPMVDTYMYMALYKNIAIEFQSTTMETANKIFSELGFPDRSYTAPDEETGTGSSDKPVKEKEEDIRAKENIEEVAEALKLYQEAHGGLPEIRPIEGEECTGVDGTEVACEEFQFPEEPGVDSGSEVRKFYLNYIGQLMHMGYKVALNFYEDLNAESETEHYSGWSQANIKVFYDAHCKDENTVARREGSFAVIVADDAEKKYFCAD